MNLTTSQIFKAFVFLLALGLGITSCTPEENLIPSSELQDETVETFLTKDVKSPEDFPTFQALNQLEQEMILDLMEEEMEAYQKMEQGLETRFFIRNRDIFLFRAAIVVSGLWKEVIGRRVTAFAPSNEAFLALGIDNFFQLLSMPRGDLRTILEYHIVPNRRIFASQLENGFLPTLNGAAVEIQLGANGIKVNDQQVTRANIFDLIFFNGVVHKIDGILIPPSQNIVEIAVAASQAEQPQFVELVNAVVRAGLADDLSTEGPFTVFAPTDEAFADLLAALGANSVDDIDLATLEAVLLYHVVPARVFSSDLTTGTVTTLNGTIGIDAQALTIDDNGTNIDANIIAPDIQGTNGVIHVIDKVLLP